jgi:hypothetical protein
MAVSLLFKLLTISEFLLTTGASDPLVASESLRALGRSYLWSFCHTAIGQNVLGCQL